MPTINIADKTTLDTVKTTVDSINTAVAVNNTENATGTLSQKLTAIWNFVSSRVGAPTDGGGTTSVGSIMAKLNAILNKVETGVAASIWHAIEGTSITLASKTTATTGTSTASGGTEKQVSLLNFTVPADGVYQWSVNGITSDYSSTAGGTSADKNITNNNQIKIYLTSNCGSIPLYAENTTGIYAYGLYPVNATVTEFTGTTTSVNKSGLVYLHGGIKYTMKLGYNRNSYSGFYGWVKCTSAYVKYAKS